MKKIIISGEIGWDVMPSDIREQLDSAKGADLDVHIASPGGYVYDGLEIYNMFRDYKRDYPKSQNIATIKGVAASMASYLAVNPAFDLVAAEDNAVFMIHNVWGGTVGDYRDMGKAAEVFEGLTGIIATAYAAKTGADIDDIRADMDDESWFFGSEIMDAGYVDDMVKTEEEPETKSSAVARAKLAFSAVAKKVNEAENKTDYQKIAAMVKPTAQTPAVNAGKIIPEVKTMTLDQLMAENPAAKIEYENALKAQFDAGKTAGRESLQSTIKTAAKYLGADSTYPATIKKIAVDVLNGEKTAEALETTVSAFDAFVEANASGAAQGESSKIGDTPGEQNPELSQDGIIRNDADFAAEIARSKAALGMEV